MTGPWDEKRIIALIEQMRADIEVMNSDPGEVSGAPYSMYDAIEAIESLSAAIAAATRQSGDVEQAPGEAPQSGGAAASPKGNRR